MGLRWVEMGGDPAGATHAMSRHRSGNPPSISALRIPDLRTLRFIFSFRFESFCPRVFAIQTLSIRFHPYPFSFATINF